MTVGELREALEGLDEDADVFADFRGWGDEPVAVDGVARARIVDDGWGVVILRDLYKAGYDRNYELELIWSER